MKRIVTLFSALLTSTTYAGGILENVDLTNLEPSPFPDEVIIPFIQERWADNCVSISYSLNSTRDPIPDPNGGSGLPLVEAEAAIRKALSTWTDIPTSYIDMQLNGTTENPGDRGFDFVNEVTFSIPSGEQFAAVSRNTTLVSDITLEGGEDIDGDGDSDVSAAITTCGDADGDGDIDLPAGFYRAGTIIDNDVEFNADFQWIIASSDEVQDGEVTKLDVQGVATHEFGHSHGLAHSMINQTSPTDGGKATMWFGGRTGDFGVGPRSLHTDDIAWSSFHYPEGSANQGPGALQAGDNPFESYYSIISGEVIDSNGVPVLGANPYAVALDKTIVSSAISGHAQISASLITGNFQPLPMELGIINGRYQLPVPRKLDPREPFPRKYWIGIEAADRAPIDESHQTQTGVLGGIYGQTNFPEDFWPGRRAGTGKVKRRLGSARPVRASKDRNGIDFTTSNAIQVLNVNEFNEQDVIQGLAGTPPGLILAVRVPTQQLIALDEGNGLLVQAALFGMAPFVSTNVPIVDVAMITTGQVFEDRTATIDLQYPLAYRKNFVGQDTDLAPLYVNKPKKLGNFITRRLAGTETDIFLVVLLPDEEQPGFPGLTSVLIMLDVLEPDETNFGYSYRSIDGGATFQQLQSLGNNVETYFGLLVTPRNGAND